MTVQIAFGLKFKIPHVYYYHILKGFCYRFSNCTNWAQFLILSNAFIELEHNPVSHSSLKHYHLSLNKLIFLSCTWHAPLIFFPVERGSSPNNEILTQSWNTTSFPTLCVFFFSPDGLFFNNKSQKLCNPHYVGKLYMPFLIKATWDPNLQRYFHELGLLLVFYYYYWLDRKLSLKEAENPKYTDVYVVGHYWFLHLGWHNNSWTKIQPSIYTQVMFSRIERMLCEIHFRRKWELIV